MELVELVFNDVAPTFLSEFPSGSAHEELHDLWKRHVGFLKDLALPQVPKHHAMAHSINNSHWTGNPARFACFFDEGMNKNLAAVCRSCHAATFDRTALAKFAAAFSVEGARLSQKTPHA